MRQIHIAKNAGEPVEVQKPKIDNKKKLTMLSAIEQVVELSEDSNLSEEFFVKAKRPINFLCKRLSMTAVQVVLLSLFIDKSDDQCIRISDLASHLRCRNVRIIRYMSEIDELEKRKYVCCCRQNRSISYRVPMGVLAALKENKEYVLKENKNLSCVELFCALDELFDQKSEDELTTEMLVIEIKNLLACNMHLDFSTKVQKLELADDDFILLMQCCHLFVENDDDNLSYHDFEHLFDRKWNFRSIKSSLSEGWNMLLEQHLIEYTNSNGFADRDSFKLTDNTKKNFLAELNIKQRRTDTRKGLLMHEKICAKTLYYNAREEKQIEQLCALLQPDNFLAVQQRLMDSGMRRGFACLFYGTPGTGKTETVYQLAKLTGRNIMQVNISEIKSMWVGESEKNIKALFDDYRAFVENSEVAPILLFNEADAIIGKRQEGAERAVDKMENSIQNIILQEMETLDGILIATTNLTQNMDKAFERRFLYKIEFEKPSIDAKTAIWQSMIPSLSTSDARILATEYDFSGGHIENIARKQAVDMILSGRQTDMTTLQEYCNNELIAKQTERRKIGFR